MISCNPQIEPSSSRAVAPVRTYFQKSDFQQNNLQNVRRTDVSVTVKLVPYQMSNGEATSYADVSLTISNTTGRNVELEVTHLAIVPSGSEQVLMSSTPHELKLPGKISLKPEESGVLEYRLKSEAKVYQRGQKVIAQIRYRINTQTEQVVQSSPRGVAFMIP
jgi:hypothetical protein